MRLKVPFPGSAINLLVLSLLPEGSRVCSGLLRAEECDGFAVRVENPAFEDVGDGGFIPIEKLDLSHLK
jgi:hypothetical protein